MRGVQRRYLSRLQDRHISLPLEECSSLSLSRFCSCGYHSCQFCLLVYYHSSVSRHPTKFRDNLVFPAWLIAVGRRKERKNSEKNTLKENEREGNEYISATLHPPSLPNTSTSHKNIFFVPFCLSLWPMRLSVWWSCTENFLNRSMWFSIPPSLFSTVCCFFSLQQPYYPAHQTSLFRSDILTATSLFQPAALGPRGLCLLQDSMGYGS